MNIKNFIEKIKDIDVHSIVDQLKNIDINELKNIDIDQVKAFLQKRIDVVLCVVMIFITLVVVLNVKGGHKKKVVFIKKEVADLEKTFKAFTAFQDIQTQYKTFVEKSPKKLSSDQLIDKIFDFAAKHDVQILSFSPVKEESDAFARFIYLNIIVSSDRYADIVKFIYAIENTPDSIQIKKNLVEQIKNNKKNIIKAELNISSVSLKK